MTIIADKKPAYDNLLLNVHRRGPVSEFHSRYLLVTFSDFLPRHIIFEFFDVATVDQMKYTIKGALCSLIGRERSLVTDIFLSNQTE